MRGRRIRDMFAVYPYSYPVRTGSQVSEGGTWQKQSRFWANAFVKRKGKMHVKLRDDGCSAAVAYQVGPEKQA